MEPPYYTEPLELEKVGTKGSTRCSEENPFAWMLTFKNCTNAADSSVVDNNTDDGRCNHHQCV